MLITSAALNGLRTGFRTNFRGGLEQAPSQYLRVATVVPSTAASETYGWLGKIPNMREWLGDRLVQNLSEYDYLIRNRSFETTIGVNRDHIRDDNIGQYAPLMTELGMSVSAFPDQLVWPLLKAGFTTPCFDKQYYFDIDHPVLDENGVMQSVANTDGGSGTPWFLLCTKRAIKPLIYQEREKFEFVAKDDPNDDNVFWKKEFIYGVDGRCNVGFGFWQFAWGSRQTLNPANYEIARVAIQSFKADYGRPLGLTPDLLVVPPSLGGAARSLLTSALINGGETNKWAGTAEVMEVPWLA